MIGETVGSFRIVRQLGKGGMGVVYVAQHVMLDSRAAVKMLTQELSEDRDIVDRFFNEAKAATQIKHPAIVQIFDFGFHATGSAFIVMELLEGESLRSRIARGPLPPQAAAVIARQVASALSAAHKAGIVHRDLKPDNLFLVPDPELPDGERVKVLDFGIAKLVGSQSGCVTTTGEVLGTPLYMSPEQCKSAASVDARTDIYALGCILYEMLTRRRPFAGGSITELITQHLFESPKSPTQFVDGIPAALEQTVLRALAKSPTERQPTMAALAAELDAITGRRMATPVPSAPDFSIRPPGSATPTAVSTTLGRSAGQLVGPPRRSRRGVLIGVSSLVAVAVVAFVVMSGGEPAPAEKASSSQPVSSPATPATDAGIADAPAVVEATSDAAAPVAEKPPVTEKHAPPVVHRTHTQPKHSQGDVHAPPDGSGSTRFNRGD